MSNTLTKNTSTALLAPGVPATAGTPYQAPYCITIVSYKYNYQTIYYVNDAGQLNEYQIGTGLPVSSSTTVCFPAVPAVAPTPGSPEVLSIQYNLGWNSGARSINALAADGAAQFSVLPGSAGVVSGFYGGAQSYSFAEVQHGLYFRKGLFSVIESGVEKTGAQPFVLADVFSVVRSGTTVRYFQNSTLLYVSTVPSYGTVFLDSSLYSGGDQILNSSLSSTIPAAVGGVGEGSGTFLPAQSSGGVSQATAIAAFLPATSSATGHQDQGGAVSFAAPVSFASEGAYATGLASFSALTSGGTGGQPVPVLALAQARFQALLSTGHGITEGTTIKPSTSLGDNTALWVPNQWAGFTATIISGTGAGQSLTIADNNPQALLFNTAWGTVPDATSVYQISLGGIVYDSGTVTPGGNVLRPLASLGANRSYGAGVASFAPMASLGVQATPVTNYALLAAKPGILTASGTQRDPNAFYGSIKGTLSANFGGFAKLSTKPGNLMATGTGVIIGRARLTAPAGKLTASGTAGSIGAARLTLPTRPKLNAYTGAVLSVRIGGQVTLIASGTQGSVGKAVMRLPLCALVASGGPAPYGSAVLIGPALRAVPSGIARLLNPGYKLVAYGSAVVAVSYEAYAINLNPGADMPNQVTHYTNFPFNQVIRHNGAYYGVADDGLYLLEGDTDAGAPIAWNWQSALSDLDSRHYKRAVSAYIGGRLGANTTVRVIVGEQGESDYSYAAVRGATAQSYRAKFGRGLKSRYYAIGMQDPAGSQVEIDTIELEMEELTRSI